MCYPLTFGTSRTLRFPAMASIQNTHVVNKITDNNAAISNDSFGADPKHKLLMLSGKMTLALFRPIPTMPYYLGLSHNSPRYQDPRRNRHEHCIRHSPTADPIHRETEAQRLQEILRRLHCMYFRNFVSEAILTIMDAYAFEVCGNLSYLIS